YKAPDLIERNFFCLHFFVDRCGMDLQFVRQLFSRQQLPMPVPIHRRLHFLAHHSANLVNQKVKRVWGFAHCFLASNRFESGSPIISSGLVGGGFHCQLLLNCSSRAVNRICPKHAKSRPTPSTACLRGAPATRRLSDTQQSVREIHLPCHSR